MALLDPSWLPNVSMRRVIVHWTGGGYRANDIDRAAYHLLIQGDGSVVRGTHSIADNVSTADGRYAAHTKGANTGSIGVSMCAMKDCREKPFRAGPFPLKEIQWETMLCVVAELCARYGIAVAPQTVLGHGEVQATLGIAQNAKWDPMVLPWAPGMTRAEVGSFLRAGVKRRLDGEAPLEERPVKVVVEINGRPADGFIFNGALVMSPGAAPVPPQRTRGGPPAFAGAAALDAAELDVAALAADVEEATPDTVEIDGETLVEVDPDAVGDLSLHPA